MENFAMHHIARRADGGAAMAYVGRVPWHGLGDALQPGAPKEVWIKSAGFDFEVISAPVQFDVEGKTFSYPDKQVLFRSDNNKPLSVVSDSYNVVQPAQIMDYFDMLATRAGFQLETAGVLFGGKQYWALATVGEEAHIADPRDKVRPRLLLSTSVDLSLPTRAKFVCERVVCHNTLTMAHRERGATEVRVNHRSIFNPDEVNEKLGIEMLDEFKDTLAALRRLAEIPFTEGDVIHSTLRLLAPNLDKLTSERQMQIVKSKPAQRIVEIASDSSQLIGSELDSGIGTAWGWLNAVTQYCDHESGARSDELRLSRQWFGDLSRIKDRAFAMVTGNTDRFSGPVELSIDD